MDNHKVVIIDGMNWFIRYFSADSSLNEFGLHCGGFSGSLKGLRTVLKELNPSELIFVFDGKNNSKRKQAIDENYKNGSRVKLIHDLPQDTKNNFERELSTLKMFLNSMPVKIFFEEDVEADDVIGQIIYSLDTIDTDIEKIIISKDADFQQLISESCFISDPSKKYELMTNSEFVEKWGFNAWNFHIYKTFVGEGSNRDNIPRILSSKKTIEYFSELLESEEVVTHRMLIDYINNNCIDVDIERVEKNYNLVNLHNPNISSEGKIKITDCVRNFDKRMYSPTGLLVKVKLAGIGKHFYADTVLLLNKYKLKNNKYSEYVKLQLGEN